LIGLNRHQHVEKTNLKTQFLKISSGKSFEGLTMLLKPPRKIPCPLISLMQATIASDHIFAILASTQLTFMTHGEDGRKLPLHVCNPHTHKRKFTYLEVPKILASVYKTARRKITELPRVGVEGNKLKHLLYYTPANSV
jgi:hypothetical protein